MLEWASPQAIRPLVAAEKTARAVLLLGGPAGVAMLLLPTFCPDCGRFTMEVVEYGGDDSYEARCTDCGYRGFGKIAPELLVAKGAIDSTPQKTT